MLRATADVERAVDWGDVERYGAKVLKVMFLKRIGPGLK
jgi:hypothetical protein